MSLEPMNDNEAEFIKLLKAFYRGSSPAQQEGLLNELRQTAQQLKLETVYTAS